LIIFLFPLSTWVRSYEGCILDRAILYGKPHLVELPLEFLPKILVYIALNQTAAAHPAAELWGIAIK
jgi:hypothetical protein